MNILQVTAISLLLVISSPVLAEQAHEDEGGAIELSLEQQETVGVVTETVEVREMSELLHVPAEVVINAYQSARVTPRVQAQIVARHIKLGDNVSVGQALVTLSSVAMAEAQGNLMVTDREWLRVKSLGQKAVGARRYVEAKIARQQAFAKVLAYGMQEKQANALLQAKNSTAAIGEFDLLAPLSGTVLSDNFITGELIEPGRVLVEISDESILWVEARVSPTTLSSVTTGAPARVSVNNTDWFEGKVIQLHHQLNETTRTQGIRIAVNNPDDHLHPGQFAKVEISTGPGEARLAVPNNALTLIKGENTLFKLENGNEFHPQSVQTGAIIGDWTVILSGIQAGDEIAVEGIFQLKSLLLKSSLGEGHGH